MRGRSRQSAEARFNEEPAMSQADILMHEAHTLAERIRRRRSQQPRYFGHTDEDLAVLERRLTALWGEIRAARASAPAWGDGIPAPPRTRPKWE
jgi:hypothetical protein